MAGKTAKRGCGMGSETGCAKGEVCNRCGCKGVIEDSEPEGSCSCHVNPPCPICVDSREFCPVCDWSGLEEQKESEKENHENITCIAINTAHSKVDPDFKITYKKHSGYYSYHVKGTYNPDKFTLKQLLEKIGWSDYFGGRDVNISNGSFDLVYYTD